MNQRLKYFLPLIVFIGLSIFLWKGIELDPSELPSPLIGKRMPSFALPVLGQQEQISQDDLLGRTYLLNVWATWCPSCKIEHPYLNALARQDVNIIGLNYKDDTHKAEQWLHRLGNPYVLNIVDHEGRLGLDLGVFGAPETFVIDKQGVIRYKHVGVVNEKVWTEKLLPVYQQYQ